MKASVYRDTINPRLPCYMEGYGPRWSNRIHDNLNINSFVIEADDGCRLYFHVLDLILVTEEFVHDCKTVIHQKLDIEESHIFIMAIHTHAGPKVSVLREPTVLPDTDYMEMLKQVIVKNTERCQQELQICYCLTRSAVLNECYTNRNGLELPYNNQADVLEFYRMDGDLIFSVVNMACHPTVLSPSNLEISSDYVGALRNYFEGKVGHPLVFINGEGGDVSPRLIRQGVDFNEVERIGSKMGEQLLKIDKRTEIHFDTFDISCCKKTISYNVQEDIFIIEKMDQFKRKLEKEPKEAEGIRLLLDNLQLKYDMKWICMDLEAYVVESKEFRFVAIPGELVGNLGKRLRNKDHKKMFICGYTNGFNSYAVDEAEYGLYFESYCSMYPKGKADEFISEILELY